MTQMPSPRPTESFDERKVLALLADELVLAREQLEALADTLCSDPVVVNAHVASLQTLDSVGQRQAAIAEIIASHDIVATANANPLEAIMRRLGRL